MQICREAFSASTYSPIGKRKSEEQLAVRKAIRTVKIPDGVKSIEYAAFEYCENLESVYLRQVLQRLFSLFSDVRGLLFMLLRVLTPSDMRKKTTSPSWQNEVLNG